MDELITMTAVELVERLGREEVSPLELLDALQRRVASVEPAVNALPTLCFDRARREAEKLMTKPLAERGILRGLPVAVKDLEPVAGVRCTWGSPIYADFVPKASDCVVETIESNGAIIYAKTNTPEFGAGANTFNEVFGATANPWDTSKSCSGSSGGSAVALATGTAWLATGSDLGGSLRNPASFCSVVGLRPSAGRVAHGPAGDGAYPESLGGLLNQPFGVSGPMARTVPDVALLLDAMVGEHKRDPISLPRQSGLYTDAVRDAWRPRRVAFSPDLGVTPVHPEVSAICASAARTFEALGCVVEEAHPDFTDVQDIFHVNRAISFYVSKKRLLEQSRALLKPEVIWNIEKAREITLDDLARVEGARSAYIQRALAFFETYDLLLSPATIVAPYPIEQRYVESCDGHVFENYIEWCSIAYAITVTGFPAMSVPAGFTTAGLPVGLQLCCGPRAERRLLRAGALFEEAFELAQRAPIDPRPARS